jgi:hypothetical protein
LVVRRLLVPLAGLVALVVVAGGIALVLDARGNDSGSPLSKPRASMTVVATSVRPAAHHFGEPVVAELVVVADKSLVDPGSVRVNPDFTPYEPIGPRTVDRMETATSVRWRFRFPLRCLRQACAPDGARRTIDFPGTGVVYRFRSAQGPSSVLVDWPSFEVTARVPDDALAPEEWRADVTSLPAVTYRRSTTTLTAGLLGGSLVFALIGVGLVWWLARPKEPEQLDALEDEAQQLTPLERALQVACEAARDDDSPERRKALERVARELGAGGYADLADRARALAWASGAASPVAVDELARDTRAATNGDPA